MSTVKYVSYANVTLPIPTESLNSILALYKPNQLLQLFDSWGFSYPTKFSHSLPTPSLPLPPKIKLNTLYWPSGASNPAWYFNVVTEKTLNAIRNACATSTLQPLLLNDKIASIQTNLYLLPAIPLNQLGVEEEDGWLLCLTDQRFYWYWKRGTLSTKPTSWQGLYNSIGGILNKTITVDTISSDYGTPSEKWISYYNAANVLLDAVAAQVGQKIVVKLDGSVHAVNWTTAKSQAENYIATKKPLCGGLQSVSDIGRYLPASVKVLFLNTTTTPYPLSPHVVTVTLASLVGSCVPQYGYSTGIDGFSETLYADIVYKTTNASSVNAYAQRAACNWYGWNLSNLDISYPGIEPWVPTGWEHTIEWSIEKNRVGLISTTQIRRGPYKTMPTGNWFAGRESLISTPTDSEQTDCWPACGWIAGMATSWCFHGSVLNADGQCAGINLNQTFELYYATATQKWISRVWNGSSLVDKNFVYHGGSGPLRVWLDKTNDQPTIAASINDIELVLDCCGDHFAVFEGGPLLHTTFCTGAVPTTPCSPNTFRVKVECSPCPINKWGGPGWYCIDVGSGCPGAAAELLEEDKYNTNIVICSGPYATQAAAEAVCSAGVSTTCCVPLVPSILYVHVTSGAFNDFTSWVGDYILIYNTSTLKWEWSGNFAPGKSGSIEFYCAGSDWFLTVTSNWLSCTGYSAAVDSVDFCADFNATFVVVSTCVGGTVTVNTTP